jgi:hypothetical protein
MNLSNSRQNYECRAKGNNRYITNRAGLVVWKRDGEADGKSLHKEHFQQVPERAAKKLYVPM